MRDEEKARDDNVQEILWLIDIWHIYEECMRRLAFGDENCSTWQKWMDQGYCTFHRNGYKS